MAKLILLLNIVAVAYAFHELQDIKPGEKPACKDQDGNIHGLGSKWAIADHCSANFCNRVSETQVKIFSALCQVVDGPAHCIIKQDNSKIYPECCAQLKPNCQ